MFPIIFGFAAALAFDTLAYATYGHAALTDYAWVSMVSWALIGGGIAVYTLTRPIPTWLARLGCRARALLQTRLAIGHAGPLCA
jgi:predicted metal-dependent HD superfamily phosphohydrolase